MPELNIDPTQLQQAAVGLNEFFNSLVASGFTEDQALTLLAKWVIESGRSTP